MAQLVARFVRDEEAFGSSPNTPTRYHKACGIDLRRLFYALLRYLKRILSVPGMHKNQQNIVSMP